MTCAKEAVTTLTVLVTFSACPTSRTCCVLCNVMLNLSCILHYQIKCLNPFRYPCCHSSSGILVLLAHCGKIGTRPGTSGSSAPVTNRSLQLQPCKVAAAIEKSSSVQSSRSFDSQHFQFQPRNPRLDDDENTSKLLSSAHPGPSIPDRIRSLLSIERQRHWLARLLLHIVRQTPTAESSRRFGRTIQSVAHPICCLDPELLCVSRNPSD